MRRNGATSHLSPNLTDYIVSTVRPTTSNERLSASCRHLTSVQGPAVPAGQESRRSSRRCPDVVGAAWPFPAVPGLRVRDKRG